MDRTAPNNGLWRDADWLFCRNGKCRPVELGKFPLAHGIAARMGHPRSYGNAINAEVAKALIEAYE
jgi:DNA (cytosine-5)-methyltransferase 1